MAQAITTKFLGATNTRGARIKATSWLGSVTVGYDYALETNENHLAAIKALLAKISKEREVNFKILGETDGASMWSFMGHNVKGDGYTVVVS